MSLRYYVQKKTLLKNLDKKSIIIRTSSCETPLWFVIFLSAIK